MMMGLTVDGLIREIEHAAWQKGMRAWGDRGAWDRGDRIVIKCVDKRWPFAGTPLVVVGVVSIPPANPTALATYWKAVEAALDAMRRNLDGRTHIEAIVALRMAMRPCS